MRLHLHCTLIFAAKISHHSIDNNVKIFTQTQIQTHSVNGPLEVINVLVMPTGRCLHFTNKHCHEDKFPQRDNNSEGGTDFKVPRNFHCVFEIYILSFCPDKPMTFHIDSDQPSCFFSFYTKHCGFMIIFRKDCSYYNS